MENKKLIKYLLNDLSELDEMFAEKGKNSFDELEMEFIQNRVTSAKRLVQLFLEKENNITSGVKSDVAPQQEPELPNVDSMGKSGNQPEEITQRFIAAQKSPGVWIEEKTEESPKQTTSVKDDLVQQELQLEDDAPVDNQNIRLGDSFSKEKSVNDLMSEDFSKLEHKLSNRPVTSIQSAIGINDRFQYIRELFEGSADNFVKTVADLDSLNDIREAVDYLQNNFKWKKNDTSLKFVNLIKRRFPHE